MLFNSAVVMPLLFVVASLSVLLIGLVTFEDTFGVEYVLTLFFDEVFLRWPLYLFVQITAAGALLINLLARRSLLMRCRICKRVLPSLSRRARTPSAP